MVTILKDYDGYPEMISNSLEEALIDITDFVKKRTEASRWKKEKYLLKIIY